MESLVNRRDQVELRLGLGLGASRWEACRELVAEAIRVGMIPTINSMLVIGLVSLPGMMTGQILQGSFPNAAVTYQIVVLFMSAAATARGLVAVLLVAVLQMAYRRLTSRDHQLRLERLRQVP